jgi:Multicopper oxidase
VEFIVTTPSENVKSARLLTTRINTGPDVGNFVFHCHILEHEDGRMMNIIRVVQPTAKKGNQAKPATESNPISTGGGR